MPGDIRSAARDANGDLWFISSNGVSRLRPAAQAPIARPSTRVSAVRINGTPLRMTAFGAVQLGPVELSARENSLDIDFAGLDYSSVTPLRFQFRMEGREENWHDLGTDSTVHLLNLAPGWYRVQARARSVSGPADGEPASFTFRILAPYWQRWWFQLGWMTVAAGIAYLIHSYRLRHQIAIERIRSRIATDLHDDIGASLSRIVMMGETLKSRQGDARLLEEIIDSSRRLVSEMADIVWSMNPHRDHLGDLASRLRAFGSDLFEPRGIHWTLDAPATLLEQSLSPDVRRQVYLIFKEAIHNVSKHSDARAVLLRIWIEQALIRGELVNDGSRSNSKYREGTGLQSMRQRAEQLGGSFELLESATGGTIVSVSVPLHNNA